MLENKNPYVTFGPFLTNYSKFQKETSRITESSVIDQHVAEH